MSKTIKFLISLVAPLGFGAIGSIFTIQAIPTWYAYLNKPFFAPPNWLFGPVWTLLYILMGIACYLIWQKNQTKKRDLALKWYLAQLLLNAIWTPIFFGIPSPVLGFTVIILMLISIIFTIIHFSKLNKTSAYLLIPYVAWVSFASLLNAAIMVMN